jgi:hypothetical protein
MMKTSIIWKIRPEMFGGAEKADRGGGKARRIPGGDGRNTGWTLRIGFGNLPEERL